MIDDREKIKETCNGLEDGTGGQKPKPFSSMGTRAEVAKQKIQLDPIISYKERCATLPSAKNMIICIVIPHTLRGYPTFD